MKLIKPNVLIALTLIFSCRTLVVENPSQKLADFLVNSYLTEGDLRTIEPVERRFQFEAIDLNKDGKSEYIIFLSTRYFCGTGGCNFLILDSNFKLITDVSVTNPPIYVDTNSTSGWKNLILGSDGSYHKMIYNKTLKTYPTNPSVEPKIDLRNPASEPFRVLFKNKISIKEYVF